MKNLLLFIILSSLSHKGQTINETIIFINEAIKESTKSAIDWNTLDQIKVNDKGKIINDSYIDLGDPNYTLLGSRVAYLKNLKYSEIKYFSEQDGTNHYVVILKCRDGSNCVSRQGKGQNQLSNVNEIALTLYNKELSEKVKNALIHLINLANENTGFLTKDMF